MRFLADESCDFRVVRVLRTSGHDVIAVCDIAPRADDADIIELAAHDGRIVLTEDKDFGQLVYAHGHPTSGVVFIRYPANARAGLAADIIKLVDQKGRRLSGGFVVAEPGRIRIGRTP